MAKLGLYINILFFIHEEENLSFFFLSNWLLVSAIWYKVHDSNNPISHSLFSSSPDQSPCSFICFNERGRNRCFSWYRIFSTVSIIKVLQKWSLKANTSSIKIWNYSQDISSYKYWFHIRMHWMDFITWSENWKY